MILTGLLSPCRGRVCPSAAAEPLRAHRTPVLQCLTGFGSAQPPRAARGPRPGLAARRSLSPTCTLRRPRRRRDQAVPQLRGGRAGLHAGLDTPQGVLRAIAGAQLARCASEGVSQSCHCFQPDPAFFGEGNITRRGKDFPGRVQHAGQSPRRHADPLPWKGQIGVHVHIPPMRVCRGASGRGLRTGCPIWPRYSLRSSLAVAVGRRAGRARRRRRAGCRRRSGAVSRGSVPSGTSRRHGHQSSAEGRLETGAHPRTLERCPSRIRGRGRRGRGNRTGAPRPGLADPGPSGSPA